jgi:iron(II)-dependent oxidoreductase
MSQISLSASKRSGESPLEVLREFLRKPDANVLKLWFLTPAVTSLGCLGLALLTGRAAWYLAAAGCVACCAAVSVKIGRKVRLAHEASLKSQVEAVVSSMPTPAGPPTNTAALVEEMLTQGRYALLLRPQIAPNLTPEQLRRALTALEQETAFVPGGQLCIGLAGKETDPTVNDELDAPDAGEVVDVDDYRIDRFCITNKQFYHFVMAGGYTQAALWDPQVWPAVVEFVDRTGTPGPRFWHHGRYNPAEESHPVIGISWYEAAAYARWLGKRLLTDPEWEKAGCWPVQLEETILIQRRYPWGDLMERERTNLWGSGAGKIVAVDEYPNGVSAGGVYQLVGNVWEWTGGDFGAGPYHRRGLSLTTPMKSIRGGAYDTYFEHQATCQYQSGENPVSRKHNISFRCAVSICDLAEVARRLRPAEYDQVLAKRFETSVGEEVSV